MKKKKIKIGNNKTSCVFLSLLLIGTALQTKASSILESPSSAVSQNAGLNIAGEVDIMDGEIVSYDLTASQSNGTEKKIINVELTGKTSDDLEVIITFSDYSTASSKLLCIYVNEGFMKCIPKECASQ